MSLDPVLLADTRAWLRRAGNDLRAAEIDRATTPPLLADALFHAQQAAEKSFKALLEDYRGRLMDRIGVTTFDGPGAPPKLNHLPR